MQRGTTIHSRVKHLCGRVLLSTERQRRREKSPIDTWTALAQLSNRIAFGENRHRSAAVVEELVVLVDAEEAVHR